MKLLGGILTALDAPAAVWTERRRGPTIVSIYNFTFHSAVFNSHQGPLGVFGWIRAWGFNATPEILAGRLDAHKKMDPFNPGE